MSGQFIFDVNVGDHIRHSWGRQVLSRLFELPHFSDSRHQRIFARHFRASPWVCEMADAEYFQGQEILV